MIIVETTTGTIIVGKVEKKKFGTGGAAQRLTILTLSDCVGGPKRRKVKCLCWNGKKLNLSTRAQRLKEGDIISARVEFDKGDPNKCTAFELKKSGTYSLIDTQASSVHILCGKVQNSTFIDSKHKALHISVYNPQKGAKGIQKWYSVVIPMDGRDYHGLYVIAKGDIVREDNLWTQISCKSVMIAF